MVFRSLAISQIFATFANQPYYKRKYAEMSIDQLARNFQHFFFDSKELCKKNTI